MVNLQEIQLYTNFAVYLLSLNKRLFLFFLVSLSVFVHVLGSPVFCSIHRLYVLWVVRISFSQTVFVLDFTFVLWFSLFCVCDISHIPFVLPICS